MDTTAQDPSTSSGQVPQPAKPVSQPVKEVEPITQEYVQPTEKQPELPREVSEAGVEAVKEAPDLTLQDQKAGITLAKEATPVTTQPTGIVQLPMTKQQAQQAIKVHKKISDSVLWLATLVLKQLKMIRN